MLLRSPECIAFISPTDGGSYTEDARAEVTAPDDTSRVDFSGTCGLSPGSDTDGSDGWASTANLGTGDGSCTITAEAFDESANPICSRSITVDRDNTAPVMTDADVADPNGDGYDTDGDLTVTFLADDGEGIGVDYYHVTVTHTSTSQSFESDVTELFASFNDVPLDGEWCGEAYAVDALGNAGSPMQTPCIIIDRVLPATVTVSGTGLENEPYDKNNDYGITWDDSADANGIAGYDMMINDDITQGAAKPYAQSPGDGTYRYKVRAVDNAGNTGEWSDTYTVIVDTTSPEILFVNPVDGGVSAPDTTLSVVTNEDAGCTYNMGSGDVSMDGETTTHSADLTGLPQGGITIAVTCEDPAGNQASASIKFTVTNELPQTSSTVVDPYYTAGDPTITAQSESETSAIEQAKYCLRRPWEQRPAKDAEEDCYPFNAHDGAFDEFKETVESTIEITGLDEGIWVAYTNALDSTDWGEYDAELFTVDTIPPMIDELNPGNDEIIQGQDYEEDGYGQYVTLRAETNEPASCEYSVEGVEGQEGHTFENGEWTGQHESGSMLLEDGTYDYRVCCVDYTDSNNGETCEDAEFTIDSVAPTTTIGALPGYSQSSFTVSWSGSDDNTGVASYTVEYNLNGSGWTPWKEDTEDTEASFTAGQGDSVQFRAKAKDKAGNEGSYDYTAETIIDSLPPVVISSSPGGTVTGPAVTLQVTTDENANCEYSDEEFEYGSGDVMSGTGITHDYSLGTLEDGDYNYYVRCKDLTAGNEMAASAIIDFDVDTSSLYDYAEWLYPTWDSFFLPKLVLDDIFGEVTHETGAVLDSLNNSGTYSYEVVWYYDGTGWLKYTPNAAHPWLNTLTEFNDGINSPYWIKMGTKDRLELDSSD